MAAHAPQAVLLPPALSYIMGVLYAPREAVERLIEAAIAALDEMDGDPCSATITESGRRQL